MVRLIILVFVVVVDAATFKRRIRNQAEREKPVLSKCRAIAFQDIIAVVRVPEPFGVAKRRNNSPAIRDGGKIGQLSPDSRRQATLVTKLNFRNRPAGPSTKRPFIRNTFRLDATSRFLRKSGN